MAIEGSVQGMLADADISSFSPLVHEYISWRDHLKWDSWVEGNRKLKEKQTGGWWGWEEVWEEERNRWGRLRYELLVAKQMSHRHEMYSVGNIVNNYGMYL